jgi:hypothetical protein
MFSVNNIKHNIFSYAQYLNYLMATLCNSSIRRKNAVSLKINSSL